MCEHAASIAVDCNIKNQSVPYVGIELQGQLKRVSITWDRYHLCGNKCKDKRLASVYVIDGTVTIFVAITVKIKDWQVFLYKHNITNIIK